MDTYPYIKALHLFSMTAWFGGQFYLVRLFIYHTEAFDRPENESRLFHEQFSLMERRLSFVIITPAMAATVIFGVWLMVLIEAWTQPWFLIKSVFLFLLFGYHGFTSRIRRKLLEGKPWLSSVQLRVWNEVATVLLICILFAAILKNPTMIGRALTWVAGITVLVGIGMRWVYRRKGMLGK